MSLDREVASFGDKMKSSISIGSLCLLFIIFTSVVAPVAVQAASDGTVVTEPQAGRGTIKVRRRQFNPFNSRRTSRYSRGRFGLPTRSFRPVTSTSVGGQSLASSSGLSNSRLSSTMSDLLLIDPLTGGLSAPIVSSIRRPYTPPVRSPYRPPPRSGF